MVAADAVQRFVADLDGLIPPGARLGLAVSGGPDSMALLLLAAAARPGLVAVVSVDHDLRDGSRSEAEAVAAACRGLGVPCDVLTLEWGERPGSALQERARRERYAALGRWAGERGLSAIATGHHADDQAETLMMRLTRGAGVRGLAGMRGLATVPGVPGIALVRPLLGWRRAELAGIAAAARVMASDDPSNRDERHERVRMRRLLGEATWIDPAALAASAAHLAEADAAIEFLVDGEWDKVETGADGLTYAPANVPREVRRRIVARAIAALSSEGDGSSLRGGEIDRLLIAMEGGGSATLRGVIACGGQCWSFRRAPPRR